jgi:hypothetical protein
MHLLQHSLEFTQTLAGNCPNNLYVHSKVGVNDDVPEANNA